MRATLLLALALASLPACGTTSTQVVLREQMKGLALHARLDVNASESRIEDGDEVDDNETSKLLRVASVGRVHELRANQIKELLGDDGPPARFRITTRWGSTIFWFPVALPLLFLPLLFGVPMGHNSSEVECELQIGDRIYRSKAEAGRWPLSYFSSGDREDDVALGMALHDIALQAKNGEGKRVTEAGAK